MFDVGFSELLLILVIGLVVLGPKRLPIAIRTVMGWIRTLRGLAANVQNELAQELKLQELQESIKKAEALNLSQLSPELEKTVSDLKQSAEKMKSELNSAQHNVQVHSAQSGVKEEELSAPALAQNELQNVAENRPLVEEQTTFEQSETTLSPAEIAELAEEDEDKLMAYYPPDDDLATPTDSKQG